MSPQAWEPTQLERLARAFDLYSTRVPAGDDAIVYPVATQRGEAPFEGDNRRIDTETAIETFGTAHVGAAIRAAWRRAQRPTATRLQRRQASAALARLAALADEADVEVSADSPRSLLPPGAGRHLRRTRLRVGVESSEPTLLVEVDPSQPMYPTVLSDGEAVDIAPPTLATAAVAAASNRGGRRPPAVGATSMLRLADALAKKTTAIECVLQAGLDGETRTQSDDPETVLERLLASAWPVLTPGDGLSMWRIDLGAAPGEEQPALPRPMYLHASTRQLYLQPSWSASPAGEQARIESLMRRLLETAGRKPEPRWTNRLTRFIHEIRG